MGAAIRIEGVTKNYDKFTLDHIHLDIPKGSIVGIVGENGAGKTTLLKIILQQIFANEGKIYIDDKTLDQLDAGWKDRVGIVMAGIEFMAYMSAEQVERCMANIYRKWDKDLFYRYIREFDIDNSKRIKDYSKGMKMKLNIAMALAHHPEILILDEATSGLDPVIRDDILSILQEFMEDENHTVVIATHIIGDLEKIADYIAFLHKGRLQLYSEKDELLCNYGVIRCAQKDFVNIPKEYIVGIRKNHFQWEVLVKDKAQLLEVYRKYPIDSTNLEEIILFLIKGEKQ